MDVLTETEVLIVESLVDGCTNFEIADRLKISHNFVRNTLAGILKKTHSVNRVDLAVKWVRSQSNAA